MKPKYTKDFLAPQLTHWLALKVAEPPGFAAGLCKGKKQEGFCTQGWATMQQPQDVLRQGSCS